MSNDNFKKESLKSHEETPKKSNGTFVNISNTNIRISNIKNYGISQKERLDYFVKVRQYTHTTKEKFGFIKYNKDHFEYLGKRVPIVFTDKYIPYLELPDKNYELIIAINFNDDNQFAFYRSDSAYSTDKRGIVDAGGGKWTDFVEDNAERRLQNGHIPFEFFELTETKKGKITLSHRSLSFLCSDEFLQLDSNLIIEKSVAKYLYITTYQNDNYTFYDYDGIDVFAEKEKLDKIFLAE